MSYGDEVLSTGFHLLTTSSQMAEVAVKSAKWLFKANTDLPSLLDSTQEPSRSGDNGKSPAEILFGRPHLVLHH